MQFGAIRMRQTDQSGMRFGLAAGRGELDGEAAAGRRWRRDPRHPRRFRHARPERAYGSREAQAQRLRFGRFERSTGRSSLAGGTRDGSGAAGGAGAGVKLAPPKLEAIEGTAGSPAGAAAAGGCGRCAGIGKAAIGPHGDRLGTLCGCTLSPRVTSCDVSAPGGGGTGTAAAGALAATCAAGAGLPTAFTSTGLLGLADRGGRRLLRRLIEDRGVVARARIGPALGDGNFHGRGGGCDKGDLRRCGRRPLHRERRADPNIPAIMIAAVA